MSKPNDPSPPKKGRTPQTYSPEFKAAAAKLVTSEGRSPAQVAKDLGISGSMIGRWVADARRGGPRPPAPLSATEREVFDRLRRENRVLKMEREILKKAVALDETATRWSRDAGVAGPRLRRPTFRCFQRDLSRPTQQGRGGLAMVCWPPAVVRRQTGDLGPRRWPQHPRVAVGDRRGPFA